MRLTPDHRVAILLHDGVQGNKGKTGLAMLRYGQFQTVVVIDYASAGQSLSERTGIQKDIPIVGSVEAALAYEPDALLIGIAPSGGALPAAWYEEVKQGVAAGLSVVNGLHTPMATDPDLASLVQGDQWIWDIRQEPPKLPIGGGRASQLACRRVLTVGTDMAVGKMSANLELNRVSLQRGLRSKMIATGQTNLMLGDDGVPLDAVRIDFAAGAIEQQMLNYGPDHDILYIEGQGSLLHPGSTATLPLIRGSQATHLVLVHRAGQTAIDHFPSFKIPPLPQVIQLYETVAAAGGTFAPTKVVAIALNTAHLDTAAAEAAIGDVQAETGLPCTDVVRYGADLILDAILKTPNP